MKKNILTLMALILIICAKGDALMANYNLNYTGAQVDAAIANMAALEAGDIMAYLENNTVISLGSPRGSYADLAALNTADPDHAYTYVTEDDGYWCSYDAGTIAFVARGVFQATGVADGSVTPAKTNSQIPNTLDTGNLFVAADAVIGHYINDADGVETVNALFGYVELPCIAGENFFVSYNYGAGSQRGAYFDSGASYLSAIDATAYTYVAKTGGTKLAFKGCANAVTVKINFLVADIDNVVIFQDATKVHSGTTLENKWMNPGMVKLSDSPFISNMLTDLPAITKLDYMYISNAAQDKMQGSADVWCTPPLPCAEGEIIMVENYTVLDPPSGFTSRGVYLDSDFVWLSNLPATNVFSPQYAVPADAKYVMLNYQPALVATFSVKRIHAPSPAVQIARSSIYPAIDGILISGVWCSLGDSITYYETWQPHLIAKYGLTHINCGLGSSSLGDVPGETRPAFWEDIRLGLGDHAGHLTETSDGITYSTVIPNDPDIVTIWGGANDQSVGGAIGTDAEFAAAIGDKDKNTYKGAYSYIIETLLTWKPSLRIILITTPKFEAATEVVCTLSDLADATLAVGRYYGLPVVNLYAESGINKLSEATYYSDGVHPNAAGALRIAEVVDRAFDKLFLFD